MNDFSHKLAIASQQKSSVHAAGRLGKVGKLLVTPSLKERLEGIEDQDKTREDVQYRKYVAESIGIGFELPKKSDVVPCVPWIELENAIEVSA
jgi:hypothetical protein